MAKFIFTENQLEMIKRRSLNEGAIANDRYERKVSVSVETYGVKINGEDIDWATGGEMTLTYIIEMEHRSWGVKGVSLYDIQGPTEIEIEVTPQVEDAEDINLTLPIDWSSVEIETEQGEGVITIGTEITVKLGNTESGDIIVESVHVPVYTL
jgi:hypothetical protein